MINKFGKYIFFFMCVLVIGSSAWASYTIDVSTDDGAFNKDLLGKCTTPIANKPAEYGATHKVLNICYDTMIRGVAGGGDADTYNWKNRMGRGLGANSNPGGRTTLEFLREARDRNSSLLFTANTMGIGAPIGWNIFEYSDVSLNTVVDQAADWVRYCNYIVQTYKQGDSIPAGRDADIIDELIWDHTLYNPEQLWKPAAVAYDELLAADEEATSSVLYWEIGNEPMYNRSNWNAMSGGWSDDPASDFNFTKRYKSITAAMIAEDSSIKVGPCISLNDTEDDEPNDFDFLTDLLADSAAVVDFIGYHPYDNMGNAYPSDVNVMAYLRGLKASQTAKFNLVKSYVTASGRNANNVPLIASEWNITRFTSGSLKDMAHALGTADTIFTYNELGLAGAIYWLWPVSASDATEWPSYMMFEEMQNSIGSTLVDSYTDGSNFRMYTTKNGPNGEVVVWGLNFDNTADKVMDLSLTNLPIAADKVTLRVLGAKSGATTLFTGNESNGVYNVDWTETDMTAADLSDFSVTFKAATISALVISPAVNCQDLLDAGYSLDGDLNNDCQVDFVDYSMLLNRWMDCTDPNVGGCEQIW